MYRCRKFLQLLCLTFFVVLNAIVQAGLNESHIENDRITNFKLLALSDGGIVVDKSLFIKDVIHGPRVVCISRPRSFGKTTNLEMLYEFFRCDSNTTNIFRKLLIMNEEYKDIRTRFMNKHPVIFIDFQRVTTFYNSSDLRELVLGIHERLFSKYEYLSRSTKLTKLEKKKLHDFEFGNQVDLSAGIACLCQLLAKHHGIGPIIIIDEIDSPLIAAKLSNTYDLISRGIRKIILNVLLDQYYEKAIISSVLPIFDDARFSKLPVITDTSKNPYFESQFGFTEDEVELLMREFNRKEQNNLTMEDLSKWYNGYLVGTKKMFSPKSISGCLNAGGRLVVYQTLYTESLNTWTQKLLIEHGSLPALNIQCLCQNITIKKYLGSLPFQLTNIKEVSEMNLWNILHYVGMVTYDGSLNEGNNFETDIRCPNLEMKHLLRLIVVEPLVKFKAIPDYALFSKKTYEKDIKFVHKWLKQYVIGALDYLSEGGGKKVDFSDLIDYMNQVFKGFQQAYGVETSCSYKGNMATMAFKKATFSNETIFKIDVELEPGRLKKLGHFIMRTRSFTAFIPFLGTIVGKMHF